MSIIQSFKTLRPNATIITYIFSNYRICIYIRLYLYQHLYVYTKSGNNTQNFLRIWVIIHSSFKYRHFICIYTESYIYIANALYIQKLFLGFS